MAILGPLIGFFSNEANSKPPDFHRGGPVRYHSGGGVPRFHSGGGFNSGLQPDERPAILQTGEFVISRKGVAALASINKGEAGNMTNVNLGGVTLNVSGVNDPVALAVALEKEVVKRIQTGRSAIAEAITPRDREIGVEVV